MGPGEKARRARHKERKRVATVAKLAALRTEGASCATCVSFDCVNSMYVCQLYSDFHGYQRVKADGLCANHTKATP